MSDNARNAVAIVRGNIICAVEKAIHGGSSYNHLIRIFKGAGIRVSKGGKFTFEKGVSIGERTLCTVRKDAELKLGKMSSLNSDCKVVCHERIEIGDDTIFGPNVMIYDHDHVYDSNLGVRRKEYKSSEIIIGKKCWIGAGAIILRGTHIGDNSVVGAGSIVKGDYPTGSKIVQKRVNIK